MAKKNDFGQYFTPDHVAEFMVGLSTAKKNGKVLEPSSGKGVFIQKLQDAGFKDIIAYEIDKTLEQSVRDADVRFESFVSANINEKFDLVIGNPPFIRWKNLDENLKDELNSNHLWKKYFNSLCDYLCIFALKSVELLNDGGELIFITPEYWLNTKHAESLRNYLVENGYFTDIIHFNETPIFNKVASSIVIFRYVKARDKKNKNINIKKYHSTQKLNSSILREIADNVASEKLEVFQRKQFELNERWTLITSDKEDTLAKFEQSCLSTNKGSLFGREGKYITLGEVADIGNGMVSGLDKAFQIPDNVQLSKKETQASISVLKGKNMDKYIHGNLHRYIFLNDTNIENEDILRKEYPIFFQLFENYKELLGKRYSYSRKINYWEWVFLRGFKLFNQPKERIFVPCKERISHKSYFRFSYVNRGIFPTQDVTAVFLKDDVKESIYYVLALLNSDYVFQWLKHKGVVKGNIVEFSEKPLASIPMRLIDWNNKADIQLHEEITEDSKKYIETRNADYLTNINRNIEALF